MALAIFTPLMLLSSALAGASPASTAFQPQVFADDAFKAVWTRTDEPVSNGTIKRSYYWGPAPFFSTMEEYAEGLGGKRLVQYFDKSRMEINNPGSNHNSQFYVTNGLLAVELISGRMQVGNNSFVTRYSAEIDIASDSDDTSTGTPTYASFRNVIGQVPPPVPGRFDNIGETVISTINRVGEVGSDNRYKLYDAKYFYREPVTGRSIPDIFWRFLNDTGPVMAGGKLVNARLNDPYFYATGYPVSDAYWASVKIAGVTNTDVLIQVYERRVLTYVPGAPEGFKVQMGNIGRHYYDWRYGGLGKPPLGPGPRPPLSCRTTPIRGFGKVWADHVEAQYALLCPHSNESAATVRQQPFQGGQMLQVTGYPISGAHHGEGPIFVLFQDGSVQQFQDDYVEGDSEPAVTAPAGLYAPKRGFGKLWREGTGAKVRERLGWATAPETLAQAPSPPIPGALPTVTPLPNSTATPTPVPGTGGAAQEFDRGYMVYAGPVLRKIYVLYNGTTYNSFTLNRWLVYDDTYREP
jgi:hypothetical protein